MSVGGQLDLGGRLTTQVADKGSLPHPVMKSCRLESLELHFVQRIRGRAGCAAQPLDALHGAVHNASELGAVIRRAAFP